MLKPRRTFARTSSSASSAAAVLGNSARSVESRAVVGQRHAATGSAGYRFAPVVLDIQERIDGADIAERTRLEALLLVLPDRRDLAVSHSDTRDDALALVAQVDVSGLPSVVQGLRSVVQPVFVHRGERMETRD